MKIGFLPFYLELYDRATPERRQAAYSFYETLTKKLEAKGLEVVTSPICRLKAEFQRAVDMFEKAEVDAIVTLHLAYSPSLESVTALANTYLPVIILNTTPDYDFGPVQNPAAIMLNHGIHGVQDLCNLLLRHGKKFALETGHWEHSDVLERVTARVQAAKITTRMKRARVGHIGLPFAGMGDFQVPRKVLNQAIGLTIVPAENETLSALTQQVTEAKIEAELLENRNFFSIAPEAKTAHRHSAKAGLTIRLWLETAKLTAFTVNFLALENYNSLPTMPFLEASLAMGRGIGYAGEGDVLTAALGGALASVYPSMTFTEMFCPDWQSNQIFLSHMGEWNPKLAAGRPELREYDFVYGKAANPVRPVGCFKTGEAVIVNLAPLAEDQFRLILAPGKIHAPLKEDNFAHTVHGWFKPHLPLSDFLTCYSLLGGTHHSILLYDADLGILSEFADNMGWDLSIITNCEICVKKGET